MNYSLVIICPASIREQVNAAAAAQGLGPDNIPCALSADGSAPATAYGCRSWASQGFRDNFDTLFPAELRNACIAIDWQDDHPGVGFTHFDEVLAANNLSRVEDI